MPGGEGEDCIQEMWLGPCNDGHDELEMTIGVGNVKLVFWSSAMRSYDNVQLEMLPMVRLRR